MRADCRCDAFRGWLLVVGDEWCAHCWCSGVAALKSLESCATVGRAASSGSCSSASIDHYGHELSLRATRWKVGLVLLSFLPWRCMPVQEDLGRFQESLSASLSDVVREPRAAVARLALVQTIAEVVCALPSSMPVADNRGGGFVIAYVPIIQVLLMLAARQRRRRRVRTGCTSNFWIDSVRYVFHV